MATSTDRIERQIKLKAPRARVWRALSDAREFGSWFGVAFAGGTFAAGQSLKGQVTYPGYEHISLEILIERFEPERCLSWRWHPAAIRTDVDYTSEPMTEVVFELSDADGGTLLKVVESGFDSIPAHRRAEAFRMNSSGWEEQMKSIETHVATR